MTKTLRMLPIVVLILGVAASAAQASYTVNKAVFVTTPVSGFVEAEETTGLPVIDDFNDSGTFNNISSLSATGTFANVTSAACLATNVAGAGADGSVALKLDYNVSTTNSYSGYFTPIGSSSFVPYGVLSFRVKGAVGGEYFKVQLSTNTGTYTKASVMITDVLSGGVTTGWQQVRIPLLQFFNLADLSSVKELVFVFENVQSTLNGSQTKGTIYIDDIQVETAAAVPSTLVIDGFTDTLGMCALGGNIATFASTGSAASATFSNGMLNSSYSLTKIGTEKGYAGHTFILGGGTGLSDEAPEGWQAVSRAEVQQYKGIAVSLQVTSSRPQVKVEVPVKIKGYEQYGWTNAFAYIDPSKATQTVKFDDFNCYMPVLNVLVSIGSFDQYVTAINGKVGITYEYTEDETSGSLTIDSISFVKNV